MVQQMKRINNRAELNEYLNHDIIECLECGKSFSFLPPHLKSMHQMTSDEYRERHNLPVSTPLAGLSYRATHRDKLAKMVQSGEIDYSHLPDASEAAKNTGRGVRRDFDLSEQSERAKRMHKKSSGTSHGQRGGNELEGIFFRVCSSGMMRDETNSALELTQSEFIIMLTMGVEKFLMKKISRKELAEIAGISEAQIYAYCASKNAVDYREITKENKIFMMWQVSSKFRRKYGASGTASGRASQRIANLKKSKAVIDFKQADLKKLFEKAFATNQHVLLVKSPEWPRVKISDFVIRKREPSPDPKKAKHRAYMSLYKKARKSGDYTELDAFREKNGLQRRKRTK